MLLLLAALLEGSGFHSPGLQGLFCARGFCPGPEAFSQQWDLRWILRFGHETRPTAGQSGAAGSAFNLWAQACSNRVLLGSAEGCRAAGRLRGSGGLTHQSFCSWNQPVKTQTGLEKKTGRQPDSPWTPDCATAESLNWFLEPPLVVTSLSQNAWLPARRHQSRPGLRQTPLNSSKNVHLDPEPRLDGDLVRGPLGE